MLRLPARSCIALVVLLSWHAPAFGAIGIGLHLAGDDHAGEELALELALAASHGHHHELGTAAHEHSAVRAEAPAMPAPELAALATVPASPSADPAWRQVASCESPPRTGPPELFYRHCALLL